jgi:hypothetical protein
MMRRREVVERALNRSWGDGCNYASFLALRIGNRPVSDPSYEQRYCAFVDILGFTDQIRSLRQGSGQFLAVRELLKAVHSPAEQLLRKVKNSGLRAQSISDAVAVSTNATREGLSVLCAALINLTMKLLHDGYFIRGAICKGLLYHDEQMVFGEALLRAYSLEDQIVRFPRIMLTSDVVQDAASRLGKDRPTFVRQAEDGPFFLHVLRRLKISVDAIQMDSKDATSARLNLPYYGEIAKRMQKRFDESVDNPKHFEKVQWFALYWNKIIERLGTQYLITGPGLDIKYTS